MLGVMTERRPDDDDTQRIVEEKLHRYPETDPTPGPEQPHAWFPADQEQPGVSGALGRDEREPHRSRPSSALIAVLAVAALIIGVLGGVAGAAGFTVLDNTTRPDSAPVVNSPVAKSPAAAPAKKGSVQQVAQAVLPSVVKINVTGPQGAGSGSGIVLSSNGVILTNNHVVAVAGQGGRISVDFNDGTAKVAHVLGTDQVTDLAVIKVNGVSGLHPAVIGDSDALQVGQQVVAIGSPFGLEATVTSGIVSALNRPVSVGEGGSDTTYPAIQTDAAINPGNSGGPLVDMAGQVIGINSSIRTASTGGILGSGEAGSIGLGFAIPITNVWPVVQQLRHGVTPTHARLGVTVSNASSKNGLLSGAGIQSVNAGSAAQRAGLRRGDVITKVDDDVISGAESLVATIRGHRPGDTVKVTYYGTDHKQHTVSVTLDSDRGTASS
jgi:putative serine protease PepD